MSILCNTGYIDGIKLKATIFFLLAYSAEMDGLAIIFQNVEMF